MPSKPQLVGIVNVTPDSFSDGGRHADAENALRAVSQLLKDGADVIDIGAESTRPGATPVTPRKEWARMEPVLAGLPKPVTFSVDTRHAETARKALALGAHWINDVSGFSSPAMVEAVRSSACKIVVMHSLCVPPDRGIVMQETDVVLALLRFAQSRINTLEQAGIARERIIFDPGIGFGKTPAQSWEIIRDVACFRELGVPLLIGHSRKSFLGGDLATRDEKTLEVSRLLIGQGVDFLRVHDVAAHRMLLAGDKRLAHG